jgi:hypothetical protein
MRRNIYISAILTFIVLFNLQAQSPVVAPAQKKTIVLKGGTVHTGTGEVISNGTVEFKNGKITFVGKSSDYKTECSDCESIDVTGKQVYPGLIFPATSLGLMEIGGGVEVATDNRELGDMNPNVRAIVAYNTDSHVIPVIRSNGILIAQIVPVGSLLPGTSSVVQLDAWNWTDAAYKQDNGIQLGWPGKYPRFHDREEWFSESDENISAEYEKQVKALEEIFSDAEAYAAIEKPAVTNLRLEALKGLFDGTKTLFISTDEPNGILSAVSFGKRHGVKKIVLSGADESAWEVKDFLKENNIPVILDNPFSVPKYDYSDTKLPFKLPYLFMKEGILTGLTYSPQSYGNLPFAAGQTVAYGLTKEEALQLVTLNNAKILGIDDKAGSLETGKDADIVVSSGDILDMSTNNIEYAFITGRQISLDNKHKQLYRRFSEKYVNNK